MECVHSLGIIENVSPKSAFKLLYFSINIVYTHTHTVLNNRKVFSRCYQETIYGLCLFHLLSFTFFSEVKIISFSILYSKSQEEQKLEAQY